MGPDETPYEGGHFDVVGIEYLHGATANYIYAIYYQIGYCHSRILSLPTSQDEVHNESISPKCLLRIRRHLSRHPQRRLVSRSHTQIYSDISTVFIMQS